MGLRPLHFCNIGGRSHDEDPAETPEKPAVQAAGQPPALPAQHDPEVRRAPQKLRQFRVKQEVLNILCL